MHEEQPREGKREAPPREDEPRREAPTGVGGHRQ